ncbi:energy-coupling factor ABC transporter permease [Conexibacter arvalis]|uniref:Cobalt/nickel transport system permease protein n=1 Tax=Conexibacter arvalis TaxID=912552 RepID=A0A840IM42_9ACTN|nr:energy-coupling factor ABC transporter permease [Conexibacter arvalis]MBB4664930.1 cobalt/nickel transport system permease protein [Conexibacter arvalis]
MHIPDGFLSSEVAAVTGAVSLAVVAVSARRAASSAGAGDGAGRRLDERRLTRFGVTTAFVFAAQMLNFPVADGTSGHLIGAALAVALLGPWLASLSLTTVLAVQALLFADGGLAVLGANVLNIGVIAVAVAWLAVRGTAGAGAGGGDAGLRGRTLVAAGAAAWLSVMAAAAATSAELALSGAASLGTVLSSMLEVHALIGFGEAAITVAAVAGVAVARERAVPLGLVVALGLAFAVAPHASAHPDGLERVAEDHGFVDLGRLDAIQREAPMPDYVFPGVGDGGVATGLAGISGTLIVFALGTGAAAAVRRRGVRAGHRAERALAG